MMSNIHEAHRYTTIMIMPPGFPKCDTMPSLNSYGRGGVCTRRVAHHRNRT